MLVCHCSTSAKRKVTPKQSAMIQKLKWDSRESFQCVSSIGISFIRPGIPKKISKEPFWQFGTKICWTIWRMNCWESPIFWTLKRMKRSWNAFWSDRVRLEISRGERKFPSRIFFLRESRKFAMSESAFRTEPEPLTSLNPNTVKSPFNESRVNGLYLRNLVIKIKGPLNRSTRLMRLLSQKNWN